MSSLRCDHQSEIVTRERLEFKDSGASEQQLSAALASGKLQAIVHLLRAGIPLNFSRGLPESTLPKHLAHDTLEVKHMMGPNERAQSKLAFVCQLFAAFHSTTQGISNQRKPSAPSAT